jgi:hypothetical protein
MPFIGTLTSSDSKTYIHQMMHMSMRLKTTLNGVPDNERAVWWLEYRTGQLIDKLNAECSR